MGPAKKVVDELKKAYDSFKNAAKAISSFGGSSKITNLLEKQNMELQIMINKNLLLKKYNIDYNYIKKLDILILKRKIYKKIKKIHQNENTKKIKY